MSNFSTEIIKSLYLDEEKFKEMMREEVEKAVNVMLETAISIFLGYEKYESSGWNSGDSRNGGYKRTVHSQFGDLHIVIPRDRNGAFKQQTVPPYIQHDNALEQTVIQLYKHGVTTGEIASLIEKCMDITISKPPYLPSHRR